MMDFDGHDEVVQYVQQGQTLLNMLRQVAMERDLLAAQLGMVPNQAAQGSAPAQSGGSSSGSLGAAAKSAQTPHGADSTPYAQTIMERSRPDMSRSAGTSVGAPNRG